MKKTARFPFSIKSEFGYNLKKRYADVFRKFNVGDGSLKELAKDDIPDRLAAFVIDAGLRVLELRFADDEDGMVCIPADAGCNGAPDDSIEEFVAFARQLLPEFAKQRKRRIGFVAEGFGNE